MNVEKIVNVSEVAERQVPVKKRYEWIDNARIIAAILVVYVHWRWRMGITDSTDYATLRSLIHFSVLNGRVPLFLILAGYFMGRSVSWKKALDRFFWLLVPFVIWNVIMYTGARLLGQPAESFASIFGLGISFSDTGVFMDPSVGTPFIVPAWFLRDVMLLSLLTPILARMKPLLIAIIIFCASTTALNFPLQQSLVLGPTTCIFYCFGVCVSGYRIDDIYRLLQSKITPVWLMLLLATTVCSCYTVHALHHEQSATLFGMLTGALMIAYAGILIEKHLPGFSKIIAPCGPACFLTFMLHHPILMAIRTLVPASIVDSWFGLLIPFPVFVGIIVFFFAMKKYTPWLMPYLGHMKMPKKPVQN